MAMAVMEKARGLKTFLTECMEELRKVTWPDAEQLRNATFVVILFTIAISIVIWFMDVVVSFVIRSIMGMFGVALVFLLRERRHLRLPERWRASRIQLPFLLLLVIPSLLNADLLSHVGGFLGGVIAALFIKPLPERIAAYRFDLSGPLSASDH